MRRVQVGIEPQVLARAAAGAPGLSFDAVVRQALLEYELRHRLRARAREATRRLERESAAAAPRGAHAPVPVP